MLSTDSLLASSIYVRFRLAVAAVGLVTLLLCSHAALASADVPSYGFDLEFGSSGTGNGQFKAPQGLAVDSAGNLFVADTENSRVQKFNAKGEYLSQFGSKGSGNGQFSSPMGMDFDSGGNLYVVDNGNARVEKFNSKGEYVSQFGSSGSGNGQLKSPRDLAVSASGDIYVLDSGNGRVEKFNSKGEYLSQFGSYGSGEGQFGGLLGSPLPMGIDVVSEGGSDFVIVADTYNHRIEAFLGNGEYISQLGTRGGGAGQFIRPAKVKVDAEGNLFVLDTGNERVQIFDPSWTTATAVSLGGTSNFGGMAIGQDESLWANVGGYHMKRWSPRPLHGPAMKAAFPTALSSAGATALFESEGESYACSGTGSPTGSGTLVNQAKGELTLKFGGCKTLYGSFTSPGQATGTIVTSTLRAEPVYLNAAKTEIGLLLKPPASGVWAEYTYLGSVNYKVTGSVIATVTNVKLNESVSKFTIALGAPKQIEEAGPAYGLQVSVNGGKAKSLTLTNETSVSLAGSMEFAPVE